MTATADEHLLSAELVQQLGGHGETGRSRGEAPARAQRRTDVATTGGAALERAHDLAVLSVVALAQLTWISVLVYLLYMLT
jgi:hypothetical protein